LKQSRRSGAAAEAYSNEGDDWTLGIVGGEG
jgi:hypothetical protein